jgi:hypothetical protein
VECQATFVKERREKERSHERQAALNKVRLRGSVGAGIKSRTGELLLAVTAVDAVLSEKVIDAVADGPLPPHVEIGPNQLSATSGFAVNGSGDAAGICSRLRALIDH